MCHAPSSLALPFIGTWLALGRSLAQSAYIAVELWNSAVTRDLVASSVAIATIHGIYFRGLGVVLLNPLMRIPSGYGGTPAQRDFC
jgi:hypothetical protein